MNYFPAHRFEVQRLPGGYVVLDPKGQMVTGSRTAFRAQAEQMRAKLQREDDCQAKRMNRHCLCCGKVFQSAGIHNRMCDSCRRQSLALTDEVRPALPRANGRRG